MDRPWATVGHAADTLVAGQTCCVRGGSYTETGTVNLDADGTEANPITLKAYPGETPTLTCQGWQGVLITGDWIVWDGIDISGSGGGPGMALTHANNCQILNCRQTGASQVGIQIYGNAAGTTNNNLVRNVECDSNTDEGIYIKSFTDDDDAVDGNRVENCHSHDNGCEGVQVSSDSAVAYPTNTVVQDCVIEGTAGDNAGVHISYSTTFQRNVVTGNAGSYGGVFVGKTGCVLKNNLIYGNLGDEGGAGSAAAGVFLYDAVECQAEILHNTIYDNNGAANSHGILFENANASTVIRGNSVSEENDQCADNGGSNATVDGNLFYGACTTPGTNAITTDPTYADPGNGNFHLTVDSPGIDEADNSTETVDLVIRTRSTSDCGAYEIEKWATTFADMGGLTNLLGTMAVSGGYAQGSARAADEYNSWSNPEMDDGTTNWEFNSSGHSGAVVDATADPGVASPGTSQNVLKLTRTEGGSGARQRQGAIEGAHYSASVWAFCPNANIDEVGVQWYIISGIDRWTTARNTWQKLHITATARWATCACYFKTKNTTAGELAYFDAFDFQLTYAIAYHEFAASATLDWGVVMPASGTTPRLLPFRISDAINLWQVRILPNTPGPDTYLIERVGGVEIVRASADVDWSVGATDEARVVARGTTITVYHRKSGAGSWTEACSYGSATFNQTATWHGIAAYDTGANLFSYLRMVA